MVQSGKVVNKIQWTEIAIASGFWLLLMILTPFGWNVDWPMQFWVKQIIFAIVLSAIYFLNSAYWVPGVLLKKGLLFYGGVMIVTTALVLVFIQLIEQGLELPRLMHEIFRPNAPYTPRGWFRFDFAGMLLTFLAFGISTSITLLRKGQQDAVLREELERQKVSNELSFLKAQINPHFFFNTLNSIYSLTSINLQHAQEAIHTLSAMMRHVLYESRKDHTLLSQEIRFIENYIELMKLRMPKKVTVEFSSPEQTRDELIAPMLLLPFVENAFKHGVTSKGPSTIQISISQNAGNNIRLHVKNQVFPTNGKNLDQSGIGLANTRRRLELIYPDKHEIRSEKVGDHFIVDLSIDLS